jgi:hypothetical protein
VKKTRQNKNPGPGFNVIKAGSALTRIAAIAAVLMFALVGGSAPARAHATLVSADPADGVLLTTAPSKLWLTFSEAVKPLQLQLTLPTGEVLRYHGGPVGWLFTLGAPMKGVLWETTAVREIRGQAKALAERITCPDSPLWTPAGARPV